jgi:hypothetical protein
MPFILCTDLPSTKVMEHHSILKQLADMACVKFIANRSIYPFTLNPATILLNSGRTLYSIPLRRIVNIDKSLMLDQIKMVVLFLREAGRAADPFSKLLLPLAFITL